MEGMGDMMDLSANLSDDPFTAKLMDYTVSHVLLTERKYG